jgi:hypothetical protein
MTSLWDCLHDGTLTALRGDAEQGAVSLEVDVFYVREWLRLPEICRFSIELHGVRSALARGVEGEKPWHDVSSAVAAAYCDISDASLERSTGSVCLRLSGMVDGDEWVQLEVEAAGLDVKRSDGAPFGLDELVAAGEEYWEAFSQRSAELNIGRAADSPQ